MHKFNAILEEYGVFGFQEIAKPILSALVSEEPILLVGEHGIGKTLLAEKLALALGISNLPNHKEFNAYDASKSLFEDVIGFPNPNELKNGKLEYIASDLTIWNKKFILVDEISRANPSMQNKWLEIIRSRRIMGKEIPNLKYIFAAMNPLEYAGVTPLDEALADRFSLIINVPDRFADNDLLKIINSAKVYNTKKSVELITMINELRKISKMLNTKYGNAIDTLIVEFTRKVQELDLIFSPRKAAMLKRNMLIFLAMDFYESKITDNKISENFVKVCKYSWNYFVTEEDPYLDMLKEAVKYATKKLGNNSAAKETEKIFKVYKQKVENVHNNSRKKRVNSQAHNSKCNTTQSRSYDDESDVVTMAKIFGAGIELFTVGFYEMVIKGNLNWKSNLKINN